MEIIVDGYTLNIKDLTKKIIIKDKELSFILDFPPYSETHLFSTEDELQEFLVKIKNNKDRIIYL